VAAIGSEQTASKPLKYSCLTGNGAELAHHGGRPVSKWGSEGREFKSHRPDHLSTTYVSGEISQKPVRHPVRHFLHRSRSDTLPVTETVSALAHASRSTRVGKGKFEALECLALASTRRLAGSLELQALRGKFARDIQHQRVRHVPARIRKRVTASRLNSLDHPIRRDRLYRCSAASANDRRQCQ
jgi:hypothetical protein